MTPMRRVSCALWLLTAISAQAQFGKGNLAVLQIGDGNSAIGGGGAPVFIREFSPNGTPSGFQVPLPTNGPNALLLANNNFTGSLTLSADETAIVLSGYSTSLPYTNSA